MEELIGETLLTKSAVLAEWRKILRVNYWSIFDIARRILEHTPTVVSGRLVAILAQTAIRLLEHRLMRSHDLTGAVFQRLIADRKYLAAYYTTPASAALLAGLAISEKKTPAGKDWSDIDALKHLRVGDFACGTGTLLSAAYQRIGQFHELVGGDASVLHSHMMGGLLVGCDVLPAAAHLTAAMLASVHPTITYSESSIITLAYGRQPDGDVALGSWDLLDPQSKFEILAITAKAAHGTGEVTKELWSSIPHNNFDLVIMNPPFTRPTGHEGNKIGITNPMFAAFQADPATQKLMARHAAKLTKGTSYHGNAGEASAFLIIADRKLKRGGTLAMVLPLSFMTGSAWGASRDLVTKNYSELILVTNAGVDGSDMCFSSDTGMGECLIVGRKSPKGSKRAIFVTLNKRPETPLSGSHIATSILDAVNRNKLVRLEDGPLGGTPIVLGNEAAGHAVEAPLPQGWQLARARDFSLAQTAFQWMAGKIWLPSNGVDESVDIDVTTIGAIGGIGPYHADINGKTVDDEIRGPFEIRTLEPGTAPTDPVLWTHDADRERTIAFEADSECVPRRGRSAAERKLIADKIASIRSTASHCHFNQNFQFNSQSTAMQYTLRRTIGGRAWLSVSLASERQEKALALWANTTLGLLLHWWLANKQQSGRGNVGKTVLQNLVVLNVQRLSPAQIENAERIFADVKDEPLRPINEIDRDDNQRSLDEKFMTLVLATPADWHTHAGPMDLLRQKLGCEPSIAGTKS